MEQKDSVEEKILVEITEMNTRGGYWYKRQNGMLDLIKTQLVIIALLVAIVSGLLIEPFIEHSRAISSIPEMVSLIKSNYASCSEFSGDIARNIVRK